MGNLLKKTNRKLEVFLYKLLFVIVLIVVVFMVFLIKNKQSDNSMIYSEEYVSVDEIKSEMQFFIYTEEEWDAFFDTYESECLNGQMRDDLLKKLGVAEYIEYKKVLKNHVISRAEWNEIYLQILDLLDDERTVSQTNILILDSLEADEKNVLFTNEGDVYTALPIDYFEKWNGYKIYQYEEKCIGIVNVSDVELCIENAYLKEVEKKKLTFLFDGGEYELILDEENTAIHIGVCDLTFSDGILSKISQKGDSIEGNLLSYDSGSIEIQGYGRLYHDGDLPVYQTYGDVQEKSISSVVLGNMQVEYVIGQDKVCAILIKYPADIKDIRVLLLAEGGNMFRENIWVKADKESIVSFGQNTINVSADTAVCMAEYFSDEIAMVSITPLDEGRVFFCDEDGKTVSNGYYGSVEVRHYEEGYTAVNSVPFEKYLYAVVPSEMPTSYQMEALKAQAVCARSYAYGQLLQADLVAYGAHINDSTSYQVYNKIAQNDVSVAAVDATEGKVITYQGDVIEAYYFSTSMGYTFDAAVWNAIDDPKYGYLKAVCLNENEFAGDLSKEEDFKAYITTSNVGYDSEIKFYRWKTECNFEEKETEINNYVESKYSVTSQNIKYYKNDKKTEVEDKALFGKLKRIEVAERSESGSILTLGLQYENGYVIVKNEYNIRKILGYGAKKITYADGSTSESISILPSASCTVELQDDGSYILQGGGYGHGLGMSQNGANGLAKAGYDYESILTFFYHDVLVEDIP